MTAKAKRKKGAAPPPPAPRSPEELDELDRELDLDLTACRVCGCTQSRGCAEGCAWVAGEDLCTICDELVAEVVRVAVAACTEEAGPLDADRLVERVLAKTPVEDCTPRRVILAAVEALDRRALEVLLFAPLGQAKEPAKKKGRSR